MSGLLLFTQEKDALEKQPLACLYKEITAEPCLPSVSVYMERQPAYLCSLCFFHPSLRVAVMLLSSCQMCALVAVGSTSQAAVQCTQCTCQPQQDSTALFLPARKKMQPCGFQKGLHLCKLSAEHRLMMGRCWSWIMCVTKLVAESVMSHKVK